MTQCCRYTITSNVKFATGPIVPSDKISYSHSRQCNTPLCCVQVLASVACNFVLLDLNLSLAYPTIVIAQLHQKAGPLSLNDVQASWLGK